jgi:D-proline reductase (dithiol) PrdB
MDQALDSQLGFAPESQQPIRYIDRTHAWYDALGYGNPYRYAQYRDVPFKSLTKPLAESRVVLLTTAAPFQPDKGDQTVSAPYNAAAKFFKLYSGDTALEHDLRIAHVGIHRSQLIDDQNCWFPLAALRRAAQAGRIGGLARRFHGIPTNRSQRHTIDTDCPELLRRCREDQADVAVLVPNCPICHQTMSLTARYLEANGIATVLMGAAKDIVELCGVPRFLFSDVPLGSAAALPNNIRSQDETLEWALRLFESAVGARTTLQNPQHWRGAEDWRLDYLNLSRLSAAEIAERRAANDQIKSVAQGVRDSTIAQPQVQA